MTPITVVSPPDGVLFKRGYGWLRDNMPQATRILVLTGSLGDLLTSFVAHNIVHRHKYLADGVGRDQAEIHILKALIPAELKGDLNGGPWEESDEEKAQELLEELRGKTVEIKVE